VRLVPEDEVGAGVERCVGPARAEGTVRGLVEARGGDAAAVVQHLARVRIHRHEPALGLAAERPTHAPRVHLDLEPERVRGVDDARHRAAVVGEIVLGEGVQHPREAPECDVLEVAFDVAWDADAEVRAADDGVSGRGRHRAS
jgi:hypothetical protein